MQEYFSKIIKERETGFAIIQVPTGYGKTFEVAHKMMEMAKDPSETRKIIYLTTLNKNLPNKELLKQFNCNQEEYDKYVLRIRANLDEAEEKINDIDIPEEFKNDAFYKLQGAILNYSKNKNIRDKGYKNELYKRADDAEKVFRKSLTKRLANEFPIKEERLLAIKTNSKYRWIGELYPAVYTDEKQILLMSIRKFLKKNSTVIEPSYDILKAAYLNNAIIFLDEFDATKADIRSEIIERSARLKNDYLYLFSHINNLLSKNILSRELLLSASAGKGRYSLDSIMEEGKRISEEYHTALSYKVAGSGVDDKQNFLFKDGTYHSVLQEGAFHIRTNVDKEENRVSIYFENGEDFKKNKSKGDIGIYKMLRDINAYLTNFKWLLYSWAERYMKDENERRKRAGNKNDSMTIDNALLTIMNRLQLDDKQQETLIGEMCRALVRHKGESLFPDNSFYERGMEIFSFKDYDGHNDYTELEYIQVLDTPEKILAYLCKKALVFGVSATADIPTSVGNYNLRHIKDIIGDSFIPMDKEFLERINKELSNKWKAYEDGRVKVFGEIIKTKDKNIDLEEECKKFFRDKDIADAVAGKIRMTGANEYIQGRYLNILYTMCSFMRNDNLRSMLYLGKALPKEGEKNLDEDLLFELKDLICIDLGIKEDFLFILTGEDFDNQREELLERLSNGEKLYIMSSYSTIGAGQNLQYKVSEKTDLIEIVPCNDKEDSRHFTKDIDAIYLGDYTHKTAVTVGEKSLTREELIEFLFQIEDVYTNDEINFKQMESLIRVAFNASQGIKGDNSLKYTDSVNLQATQAVIQAIGRLCRTHIKNKEIYVYIDEKLLDDVDENELKRRIIPPEMKVLIDLKGSIGKTYTENEDRILNRAERISTYGNWSIHQILSRNWYEKSMALWKALRDTVLRLPTADKEEFLQSEIIRKYYVTSGSKISQYLYSQFSDFLDVVIDFGNDRVAFKNSKRAKRIAETGEIRILEVSDKDSKLDRILKYPGMKKLFEENGYATSFTAKEYIMSPVMFHNIYKGALGEVSGAYILEKERGIKLKDITDPSKFEFFDFEMSKDVYVDFKNWKFTYIQDREKTLQEISKKLDEIGGKRAYIINVVEDDSYKPGMTLDERIVEIPAIIDNGGKIIPGALDSIKKEDFAL